MPFEEICKLIAQRLLQGCMNHEQFANYYDYLGLKGYKLFHEYHFFEEMFNYREFITYYIEHLDKLIPDYTAESLTSFTIIPNNWYGYKREDMDINTRRNAVKNGIEKYVRWEEDTKKFLEDMHLQATQDGFISIALQIESLICNVEKQIRHGKEIYLELKAIDYDMPTVVSKQQYLIKKYKKKLCQINPNEKGVK